jgi:PAS domain S-box-containing protein
MHTDQSRPAAPPQGATQDKLLSSIHKISSLLTRTLSLDKILTSIVKETCLVFGFTRMAIFLTDKDRRLLECRYIHGFNAQDSERAHRYPYRLGDQDCVETRVALQGNTMFVKDYSTDPRMTAVDLTVSRIMGRVSTIAVPLKIKQDVIGLITADKDDIRLKLTRKDINAFSTFANQASIIIENVRLQEQNQQKIKQLLTLQEISKKTSSTFHLGKLFQVISASALKLTKASSARLFLLDDEGKTLSMVSSSGSAVKDKQRGRHKVDDGGADLAAHAAQAGAPALLNNPAPGRNGQRFGGAAAQLAAPLISEKRVLGVLHVAGDHQGVFSEDDLKLLMIFAGHSASLIRNVRLYGQVMTERNLRENILESSPNSIISLNLHKEISSINRRTEEMFGFTRKEVLGKKAAMVFDQEIARIIDLALDDHAVVNRKEIKQTNGAAPLGVTSSLLRNHQSALIGAMIIVRDLTEEKKTDELIRRIDRLTSLGQLSAGIAHEIRNPLASIYFNVQLLAKKLPAADPTHSLLNDTQEGVNRIRTLVKGMLDFAKPSPPSLKHDSLPRIIHESIALMESQLRKNKVEAALHFEDNLPDIVCDAHQIQQVLINLLINAMEAMPKGGRIDLEARFAGPGPCGEVTLRCTDHGVGISPENLGKIFNPFFTTKPEGTGLGLSISHKILEQHHVAAEVTSQPGQGTSFLLKFPACRIEEPRCTATPF